jgi:hypothetical protein
MLMVSPVCHFHYFCLWLPLVMVRLGRHLAHPASMTAHLRTAGFFALLLFAAGAPVIAPSPALVDAGLAVYGGLLLWGAGIWMLARAPEGAAVAEHERIPALLARRGSTRSASV